MDDCSLNDPGSCASWPLEGNNEEAIRHVRIQQTGKNASGQTHYLSLSGFEIYGTVLGVCDDLGNISYFVGIELNYRNLGYFWPTKIRRHTRCRALSLINCFALLQEKWPKRLRRVCGNSGDFWERKSWNRWWSVLASCEESIGNGGTKMAHHLAKGPSQLNSITVRFLL